MREAEPRIAACVRRAVAKVDQVQRNSALHNGPAEGRKGEEDARAPPRRASRRIPIYH